MTDWTLQAVTESQLATTMTTMTSDLTALSTGSMLTAPGANPAAGMEATLSTGTLGLLTAQVANAQFSTGYLETETGALTTQLHLLQAAENLALTASTPTTTPIRVSPPLRPVPVQLTARVTPGSPTATVCATATQAGHPVGAVPLMLTTQGFPLDLGMGTPQTWATTALPNLPGASALTNGQGTACWALYAPTAPHRGTVTVTLDAQTTVTLPMPSQSAHHAHS